MLTCNQVMIAHALAFLQDEPPVMVDWLPWNHTAGGNHNFGITIFNGGTLYIDDGAPTPGGIAKTVRNLEEIAPTLYFNVPKGFEMLCEHLEKNDRLRDNFFSRVNLLQYAGAGLSQHVWDSLERLAMKAIGEEDHDHHGLRLDRDRALCLHHDLGGLTGRARWACLPRAWK
jgi:feruloyl-CoA synthase